MPNNRILMLMILALQIVTFAGVGYLVVPILSESLFGTAKQVPSVPKKAR